VGGSGADTIASAYSGKLDGTYVYNLAIDGGSGNDNIADLVNVGAGSTVTVGSAAASPAVVRGGTRNDTIQYVVNVDPSAVQGQVNAVVVGDSGKDTTRRSSNVQTDPTNEFDSVVS
jgi:hypothetical protein